MVKTAGQVTVTATTAVVNAQTTINGNTQINGDANVSGDVIASGISLVNHIHGGIMGDPSKTTKPE